MTSLAASIEMENRVRQRRRALQLTESFTIGGFLDDFHRISGKLLCPKYLENLKPCWEIIAKVLSVIKGEEKSDETGWRLRFEKPRKPRSKEIEARVALFMNEAQDSLRSLCEPNEDEELPNVEKELLKCIIDFTIRIEKTPCLLTSADSSEIAALRQAAVNYAH